ncbi:MAG: glycosyltransferase family 4 protein [Sulfuricurvum sp.]|uniref:glycosyltransferase family 4 protein n=1 Tax=Sulfuricurvum sp. TaxID=2025608 RepID=UPI0026133B84|nr:glycosyltransferase family 4 protein [Sulfuricurvum sp.]MDD2828629.1 glycosyltransferase family 4 protein [Sulfuricurvum sp.]MDD4948306.1 glycosyltransferase family 4 protein [Sulfuricurvum sp.]
MATKICELCLSPDLGGLELYMMRASRYLGDTCISVINEKGKLKGYYENTSYRYATLKRRNVLLSWLNARHFARIIDDEEIDIIHLHWTKDLPLAIMAKLLSKRRPKVVQSRHMTMTRFKDDFYHRFLYKNLDMMLAVTHQVKSQIEKFIPFDIRPKTEVLYIGAEQPALISSEERVERRRQLGLNDSFTVGIVGRIEEPKGQHILLEAVKSLHQNGIDAKAMIVGHAMDDGYLQKLQNDYADVAVFTGFTREAQTMMQLCDVIVLATENETFGLVLIEAMMCGVCVVASASGGPLEIIDDHVNGLFFKTFDSSDLADKLILLYRDSTFRQVFAEAGRIKALEVFESEKQFEQLQKVLENL